MGVDAVKAVEVGNVSHDPNLIAVEEDNFSCVFIGQVQIRLLRELIGVCDAGSEVGRHEHRERYVGREKASRYAGCVFGAGDRDDKASVGGRGRIVGDGVNVNGVGWVSPSLDLLGHLLGVWWGEDTGNTGVAKRVWEEVEQCGDSIRHTDWSEDTRAEERVATKSVEERVVGSRYVGVYPLNVGQLFNCELADWSLFAFANPF